jgi:hypothetical protein
VEVAVELLDRFLVISSLIYVFLFLSGCFGVANLSARPFTHGVCRQA